MQRSAAQASVPQYIYLDFDGAETSYYNRDLDISVDSVTVKNGGFASSQITTIVEALNEFFGGSAVFTSALPKGGEYSTVYIGVTSAFDKYGFFIGIAETVDSGNQIHNDNAFVMLDSKASTALVTSVIAHEAGHLLGTNEHGGVGLEKYANDMVFIYDGEKIEDTVLEDEDTLVVLNGGTAINITVAGGEMYVKGLAGNTTVADGWMEVYGGGVVNSTVVSSRGEFGVNYEGEANDTTVNGGSMYVSSAGIANNTTVNSYGDMYVGEHGIANDTIVNSSGSMAVVGLASGITLNAGGHLNVYTGGKAYGIDWTPFAGELFIETGATATFVSSYSGCYVGSEGEVLSTGLHLEGEHLNRTSMYVFDSGIASNTFVDYGVMEVWSGGLAIDTNDKMELRVLSGGTASNTTLTGNGYMHVYGGGYAQNITVNEGGYIWVEQGGTAYGVDWTPCIGGLDIDDGAQVTFVSNYVGVYVGMMGQILLSSGMQFDNLVLSTGDLYVFDGGVVNDTVLDEDSYMEVWSGGVANSTIIENWGGVYVSGGGVANNIDAVYGKVVVRDGGIASNVSLSSDSYLSVSSGGTASDVTVSQNADVYLKDGSILAGQIHLLGSVNIEVEGDVNTEEAELNFHVEGRSISDDVFMDFSALEGEFNPSYAIWVDSAQAHGQYKLASNVDLDYLGDNTCFTLKDTDGVILGALEVNCDEMIVVGETGYLLRLYDSDLTLLISGDGGMSYDGMILNDEALELYAGDVANNTVVENMGGLYVLGGTANSTSVLEGGYLEVTGGSASWVSIDKGYASVFGSGVAEHIDILPGELYYDEEYGRWYNGNGGSMEVCGNGSVSDVTVQLCGSLDVREDGVAENITIAAGEAYYSEDSGTYTRGGALNVYENGRGSNVTVQLGGEVYVYDNAVVENVLLEGLDAYLSVFNGGTVTNVIVNEGGRLRVEGNGFATCITVNEDSYFEIYRDGMVNGLAVYGGELSLDEGAILSGQVDLYGEAQMGVYSVLANEATFNFHTETRTPVYDCFIYGLDDLIGGALAITVESDQSHGYYRIAGDAWNFSESVALQDVEGTQLGTLQVNGRMLKVGNTGYQLNLDEEEGMLTLRISGRDGKIVYKDLVLDGIGFYIYGGETANGTVVNEDGGLYVYGGTVNDTVLNQSSYLEVGENGTVHNLVVA
ncbi:MAG: AIDA repeat-containing protein, partial [Victivallales bacterium]|nr:AIDA repeat-containing protein [Victivallales bacterium]